MLRRASLLVGCGMIRLRPSRISSGDGCSVPWSLLQRAAVSSGYGAGSSDSGIDGGTSAGTRQGIDAERTRGTPTGGNA